MSIKTKRKSIILRLLIIAASVYIIISLLSLWKDLGESQKTLSSLKAEKAQTEADIEEYRALLSDESQKAIIEKAARERFGYAYPGEEIYKEIK